MGLPLCARHFPITVARLSDHHCVRTNRDPNRVRVYTQLRGQGPPLPCCVPDDKAESRHPRRSKGGPEMKSRDGCFMKMGS